MTAAAERVLKALKALTPAELQAVENEVSQLLARSAGDLPLEKSAIAFGQVLREEPPGGHPGGSLESDDPFFQILQRIEEERHRRVPRPPPALDG